MPDRVVPIKFERTGATYGGSTDDVQPQPANPNQDGLEMRALYLQYDTGRDSNVYVTRDVSGNMVFRDAFNTGTKTLSQLAAAGGGTGDVVNGQGLIYANDNLAVGTGSPSSMLESTGSIAVGGQGVSVSVTDLYPDATHCGFLLDDSLNTINVHLPAAGSCPGRVYWFKRQGTYVSNDIVVDDVGGGIVDGQSSFGFPQVDQVCVGFQSIDGGWWAIFDYTPFVKA